METAQAMGHTGSWVYNLKTGRIWGTVEAHRIFGFPLVAGDLLLEAIEACIPERGRVHQALAGLISDEREYDIEYRVIPADGSPPREIHSIAKLEKDGQGSPWKVLGFIQDITQLKRAQEDRIAREIAEQSNRAKSEFISRMSHELRTPLNAILGFAQLLKMDEPRPDQERGVDQINKSGRHLLNLVNEVLDLARIESGKMHIALEPVRLEGALQEAIELIRPLAEARAISLNLEMAPSSETWVQADHQSLKQVLLNIFSNAVKYNREGGEIAVTSGVTLDGSLRLQVRDTGEGIAPDKMDRLFMPFDRLDRDQVAQDGTGLGLALSKGLMEAMGGSIGAESVPGVGSTFWLELKMVEV
jgi:signal transduction histidine kinase